MRTMVFMWLVLTFSATAVSGQEQTRRWERRSGPVRVPVTVFHSTQSANLPTAETLQSGEWMVEISHRFLPPVSDGADALWGLDGPVYNRLGLAWAATDRLLIGLVRTNLDDNLDLNAKVRVAEGGRNAMPWMLGIAGGVAFNTDAPIGAEDHEVQAYGQAIIDVLVAGRVGVGVVPTVLYNPTIRSLTREVDMALGLHAQFYASEAVSFLSEWIVTPGHSGTGSDELPSDGGTLGIELETGGHFFKILLTNQVRMNPSQYLAGSPFAFEPGQWRVGFNITRLLAF